MDAKLKELTDFVALLHRPLPVAAGAPARPPLPAKSARSWALAERKPAPPLSAVDAPAFTVPRVRFWVNLGCGLAAVLILSGATWLALPRSRAQRETEVRFVRTAALPSVAASTPPAPVPPQVDEAEAEEQGEMTSPDPAESVELPPTPEIRIAALVPPPLPAARRGEPAWLRFAVPASASGSRPRIAIVIDDLGLDKKRTERAIVLPGPLTLSFLAYASDLPRLTGAARRAGHELLLHVPMEPLSRAEDMGPNGLSASLGPVEVLRRLRWDFERFDGYVGINNHMGSRFTSDAAGMAPVMEELRARGLLFLDSRTIANSAGVDLARRLGVPYAARDVFLDNEVNAAAIAGRLAEVEQIARRHGSAVAIGHPHDATLAQLRAWLVGLPGKGFALVPVSAIVREHWHGGEGDTG